MTLRVLVRGQPNVAVVLGLILSVGQIADHSNVIAHTF